MLLHCLHVAGALNHPCIFCILTPAELCFTICLVCQALQLHTHCMPRFSIEKTQLSLCRWYLPGLHCNVWKPRSLQCIYPHYILGQGIVWYYDLFYLGTGRPGSLTQILIEFRQSTWNWNALLNFQDQGWSMLSSYPQKINYILIKFNDQLTAEYNALTYVVPMHHTYHRNLSVKCEHSFQCLI